MKSLLVQDIARPTSSVTLSILRVGTNTDRSTSVNTQLADLIVSNIQEKAPQAAFSNRYLSQLPINEINEAFFEGICLEGAKRTREQIKAIDTAEMLTSELLESDIIVFNVPVYPFGVQKSFRAYMEMVLRCCQSRLIADDDLRAALGMKKVVLITNEESLDKSHQYSSSAQHMLSFLGIFPAEVYTINRNTQWNDDSVKALREKVANEFLF